MNDRLPIENNRSDHMYSRIEEQHMHDYVIEQLARYGYTDIHGKSRDELTRILAKQRAMEIDVNAPANSWY